jgi:hypothetical protein
MQQLLGPLLSHLPAANAAYVAGREFFPHLITAPFHDGLGAAFGFAIAANVIAAVASALTGRRTPAPAAPGPAGYELAAVSAEGGFEPSELVAPGIPEEGTEPEPPDKPNAVQLTCPAVVGRLMGRRRYPFGIKIYIYPNG